MQKTIINCKLSDFDKSKFYFIKRQRYFDEIVLKGEKYKVIGNNCSFNDFILKKIEEEKKIYELFLINFTETKKYFGKSRVVFGNVIAFKI